MSLSRAELDSMLDELERDLKILVINEADHDDLWAAFARQADAIEAHAGADDIAHVKARMDDILRAQGIQAST